MELSCGLAWAFLRPNFVYLQANFRKVCGLNTVIFFGDSMTEGIGSERISYVSELHRILNNMGVPSSLERIRRSETLGGFPSNLWNWVIHSQPAFWPNAPLDDRGVRLINFAVEGTTIDYDMMLQSQLHGLRPDVIFVFRGVVEAVHRMDLDGFLTRCLPKRWKSMGALEPRCYFSNHWLRGIKQYLESESKSWLRRKIFSAHGSYPIMTPEEFSQKLETFLTRLKEAYDAPVVVGTMLPIIGKHFPGTAKEFENFNDVIKGVTSSLKVELLEWHLALPKSHALEELYFADGLHLNAKGNAILAEVLLKILKLQLAIQSPQIKANFKSRAL